MQDNAKITGCTAEYGGAVYVGVGTFNVFNVIPLVINTYGINITVPL